MTEARSVKVFGTVSTRLAAYALGLVASIAIARALGPAGRGSYYVLTSIGGIALQLGHLSLEQSHVYLWAATQDRKAITANSVALGLTIGSISAGVAYLIVVALGPSKIPVFSYRMLGVALVGVPLALISLYLYGLFALADRIARVNAARLVAAVIQTGTLLALALTGRLTVSGVIVIWTLTAGAPLLALVPSSGVRIRDLSSRAAARTVSLGIRYHMGMATLLLLFRANVLLLNARLDRSAVGLYSLAVTLGELTYFLADSISQVMLPRQISGTLREAGRVTARVARTNLIFSSAIMIALLTLGPFLIPALFGRSFIGSLAPLAALTLGVIAISAARPVATFLVRLNRPMAMSAISLGALLIDIVSAILLIPRFGIVGAGVAASIAYTLLAAVLMIWLCRSAQIPAKELVPRWSDVRRPLVSLLSYRPKWIE